MEYKFIETTFNENILCLICHKVMKEAVQCHEGHWFCNSCIQEWLKNNKVCPYSDPIHNINQIFPNRVARGIINNLIIHCPNYFSNSNDISNSGCSWVGKISMLENHLQECEFMLIHCENQTRGCTFQADKKSIYEHEVNCEYALISCPSEGCGQFEQRRFMNRHLSTCPFHLISCPNNCGKVIFYSNLSDHLANCSSEMITCPNSILSSGCSPNCLGKYTFVDLEQHKNTTEYLRIEMMKVIKDQSLTISRLESAVSRHETIISVLEKKNSDQATTISHLERINSDHASSIVRLETIISELIVEFQHQGRQDINRNEPTRYHPGCYRKGGRLCMWECCLEADRSSPGCCTGPVTHHPRTGRFGDFGRDWECCNAPCLKGQPGCQRGPHPHPYAV